MRILSDRWCGGDLLYLIFCVNWPPLERSPIFNGYSPELLSRNINWKKLINAIRKSTTRFLRWLSYVPLPKRGSEKRKTTDFSKKIALRLKKVCYKVALCENCQRQNCKAFIGLTNCAKMLVGGRPLLPEILDQSDRGVGAKSPIFDLFSLVAPQPYITASELLGSLLRAFQWAEDE